MKAKLQLLIKNEGLTASRFAEMLEIQPAGVSHILAGRNKPSFDLLQKILRRFPKVNPDWLLLDSEQMYRDGWNETGNPTSGATPTTESFGAPGNSGDLFGQSGNFSGDGNFSGGANNGVGNLVGATDGAVGSGRSGDNFRVGTSGSAGINGNTTLGAQNLPRGEANIPAGGYGPGILSHSHAASAVNKIVIFYADGTFEAYFPGNR